jgi:hypothetical protein
VQNLEGCHKFITPELPFRVIFIECEQERINAAKIETARMLKVSAQLWTRIGRKPG